MTPEEIARIQAIARADAQADIDAVEASGLPLTWESIDLIDDPEIRSAFCRQLEARDAPAEASRQRVQH